MFIGRGGGAREEDGRRLLSPPCRFQGLGYQIAGALAYHTALHAISKHKWTYGLGPREPDSARAVKVYAYVDDARRRLSAGSDESVQCCLMFSARCSDVC
eukprot:2732411-Rhodomonas_salina.1